MATLQIQIDDALKRDADSLRQAVEDTRQRRNLFGAFDSAEEAVMSMLEDLL